MSRWETSLGTPQVMEVKSHTTAASAQTRAEKGLLELAAFGGIFNHALRDECLARVRELKDVNLKVLPIGEWREWRVCDEPSGLVHVVKVRRME